MYVKFKTNHSTTFAKQVFNHDSLNLYDQHFNQNGYMLLL